MSNKKKINDHINKAIATTVVVTAIGLSSTINSMPVKAANLSVNKSKGESTILSSNVHSREVATSADGDLEVINLDEVVTNLLKQGNYREAREIRRSFTKYKNPLAEQLHKLKNYAVNVIS